MSGAGFSLSGGFHTEGGATNSAVPAPPILAASPHDLPKVKYISIDASVNGAQPLAIKITETTTSKIKWAGVPFNGPDIDNISALSPKPVAMDWSSFSVLHLTGCIIQPFGVYEITFVDDPPGANISSIALTDTPGASLISCAWGDVLVLPGPCDAGIGDIIGCININTGQPGPVVGFPAILGDQVGDVMDGELGIGDIIDCINDVVTSTSTPPGHTPLPSCP